MNRDLLYFFGHTVASKSARAIHWLQHPLGEPSKWPVSLKTTLSNLFNSRQPMFLFWTDRCFGFYNNAYIPILGHLKHPYVMGKTGLEIWPETWQAVVRTEINIAMQGESTWNEDKLIPLICNGQLEDGYFSYGYSPVYVEDGTVGGVLVTYFETTEKVLADKRLTENEIRLENSLRVIKKGEQDVVDVLESMSDGFIALDKNFRVLRVNRHQERLSGIDRSKTIGKNHWDIWPQKKIPKVWDAYNKVINERVPVYLEDFHSRLNIWMAIDVFPTPENGICVFFVTLPKVNRMRRLLEEVSRTFAFCSNLLQEIMLL